MSQIKEDALPLSAIPQEVVEEAGKAITDYAIGFVALGESESGEKGELGGSGTLVQIDGARGILTAYHVVDHLRARQEIGLILPTRSEPTLHRMMLKSETVCWLPIAYGDRSSEGPDLGFLLLPQVDAGALSARKSFYNLSLHREDMLSNPPARDDGIWILCGFAGELTTERPGERGYAKVMAFEGACYAGWVEREYCRGDFDYLEFEARYGGIDEPPRSFGGLSGAGLWQASLNRTPEGALTAGRPVLCGVAFHQSPLADRRRVIMCHGRRSVYIQAVESIRSRGY